MANPTDAAPLAPYRLTICGLAELAEHASAGVSHVLSILDPEAPMPRAFSGYDGVKLHHVLRFHDVSRPIGDARVPQRADVEEVLSLGAEIDRAAGAGTHLLVHCHAGVSRSTAAAAILLARDRPGRELDAMREIARVRPGAAPNARMIRLADEILERRGALVQALEDLHRNRFDDWLQI